MLAKAILMFFIITFSMLTGCNRYEYQTVEKFQAPYSENIFISIDNSVGEINVNSWDEDYILVTARIIGKAENKNNAMNLVNKTEVFFDHSPERVSIWSERPENRYFSTVAIEYQINMPHIFNGNIKTSTGDVYIEEILGDLHVATSTGDVYINKMQGELLVETSTGDVNLRHLMGDLNCSTSTGDVAIDYMEGRFDIKTSTGDVHVLPRIIARTNNRITTSTGDVFISLFENASVSLYARTSTGEIKFRGYHPYIEDEKEVRREFGFADANLDISTSTGDISIINASL